MTIQRPDKSLLPDPAMLIGGRRTLSKSTMAHSHIYPATGDVTGQLPLANAEDVDTAVGSARAAATPWAAMPANERRDILIRLGQLLREDAETLTQLSVIDNGIAIGTQQYGPHVAADLFFYNAGWTDKIGGEVIPTWPNNALDYTYDEPYGVVAVIIPWNGPVYALGMTLAPVLAAGNVAVVKPPELAPWAALRFGELCTKAGLPDGVVNIVPGGAEAGEALTRHRGVDKIHFTGSGATARHILTNAAANMTPVHLELGGKSASIIFADADLESLDYFALAGIGNNSGQGCINPTRLLVQNSIYDAFIERLVALADRLTVGDPMDPTTIIGPVIDAQAQARILGMINRAKASGARLIAGGTKLGGDYANGYFISPTVFADVPHAAELSQCEVFGPILAVSRFETEEDAIAMANGTEFGLAAYVWTQDLKRAHRFAKQLVAGNIWINGFYGIPAGAPFGGVGQSGYGRLGGIHGIREFTRPKNVWLTL